MAPVNIVHIHHEGSTAGPCSAVQCDRFSHGGYCCGIGTDTFRRWRSPAENYATADWNHRDWTPCFSGSRGNTNPAWEVTDHDLMVLHEAFMDAYNRGEVTANPEVVAHRNAGGSNATACPGDNAMARWDDIVNACRAGATPQPEPKPPEPPEDKSMIGVQANAKNHDGRQCVFQVGGDGKLYFRIKEPSGGNWGGWRDLSGGFKDFQTVTAWTNEKEDELPWIEVWVGMKDGKTFQRWQTGADRASWSDWNDRTR